MAIYSFGPSSLLNIFLLYIFRTWIAFGVGNTRSTGVVRNWKDVHTLRSPSSSVMLLWDELLVVREEDGAYKVQKVKGVETSIERRLKWAIWRCYTQKGGARGRGSDGTPKFFTSRRRSHFWYVHIAFLVRCAIYYGRKKVNIWSASCDKMHEK